MVRPIRRTLIAAALAAIVTGTHSLAQGPAAATSYRFTYDKAGSDSVAIELSWAAALREPAALVMPRAIPMGYGEQRYDAFVSDVRAFVSPTQASAVEREEGPRWRLPAGTQRVSYDVNLRLMEREILGASDSSRVRDGYLSALGYSVFAYVDGFESRPAILRVQGPAGWPVFSTLTPQVPAASQFAEAKAADFYALADAQIVMGPRASIRRLTDTPVALYQAAYAESAVDLNRYGRLAVTAFQRVVDYFGSIPFAHYTVQQELLMPISPQHAYGMSMEHLDSSTYYLAAAAALTANSSPVDELPVLYNFAHHFSHSWVPKRAYGPGYFPFQWEVAPVLDTIWFAEGFGQYAAIMAVAAGMPDPAAYRENMLATRFQRNITSAPLFLKRLPLVDLSHVASTRYSEDFRIGRLVFSRGGLMAAAIDDRVRAETKGAKSLRDAFRFLLAWSARERRAFRIQELADLIQQATGVQTQSVIDEWLRPLP
jgi:predicted metalloprotease with PDZ domain